MKLVYTLTLFLALCASLTSAHLAPPCPAETPTPPPHVNPPVVIPTPPPHVNPPVNPPTPPPHVNPPVNPPTPPPHVNPPVNPPTPPPHVNPPVNPPTPPPHVNPPTPPPHVNPPVNPPTPPPHVNPPVNPPTPPPHVNPPVVIPTPPPHVNPPVNPPTPPPHVNPPTPPPHVNPPVNPPTPPPHVNPPTPPPHVNPPVVIPTPPPHVNPPVNPPTPPPHVNPPVNPPAVVRAPICNSADVSFVAENPSSTSTCGSPRTFFLRNAGNCTLSTGGALICDNNRLNCVPCTSITPAGTGFNIVCPTLGITGSQIITDTYQLGVLEGTIATAINVQCPAPFTTPVTPPPPHTPVPCDSNSVSFQLNGPFTCGGAFTATLTTTTSCSLSSGGALVCDSDNRNCISCPATATNNVVTYHCLAKTTGGAQIVTSTYQVGNFIGTIARSQDFGCPSK